MEAAAGIYEVVTARMSDLIRKVTVESGYDPRRFCLLAYGGASGAHCTAFAAQLGVRRVICKAQTSRQCDILTRLGADRVIQPEQNSALRLAEELSTPDIIERFNLGPDFSVAEIILPDCLAWQTLAQTDMQNKHHITILLIKRGDEVHIAPKADTVLQQDDILIVFGQNQHITHFARLK